ncbi:hypothetical protein Hanom_Chr15g01379311 [Helianthus anomalus]
MLVLFDISGSSSSSFWGPREPLVLLTSRAFRGRIRTTFFGFFPHLNSLTLARRRLTSRTRMTGLFFL